MRRSMGAWSEVELGRQDEALTLARLAVRRFWANVNPDVDHPRWSQARERALETDTSGRNIPTLLYNGYEEQVAHLYRDLQDERLFA